MSSFVDNVISPYLYGFRKGYSTQHALLLLMNKINKSLDLKQNGSAADGLVQSIRLHIA